jgi:tRNA (guanine37-N1)-methyltransferase
LRKRLRKTFAEALPANGPPGVYNAFDIVGDIAITKIPSVSTASTRDVAEAIMNRHKNVKAVFVQETGVHGDFRLRGLTHVAGENRTCTVHKESGCSFMVDVEKCYFSPRLSGERLRIARLVQPGETVVNMFAGVGCFSIIIAKHVNSARVFSIDVNPSAVGFMRENIRLNRVYGRVIPLLGDAKATVERQLRGQADRVLIPLPEKAFEYLPAAVSALKPSGGWMHVHVFEHAAKTENAAEKAKLKVAEALASLSIDFEVPLVRVVRKTGPNWFQLVADVHVLPLTR